MPEDRTALSWNKWKLKIKENYKIIMTMVYEEDRIDLEFFEINVS